MKKLVFLLIFVCLSLSVFAENFFSKNRFLEVKIGADAGISNNLFSANEFMKKELVIDLHKLAEECPDTGISILANASPSLEMNLNIKSLSLGFSTGVDFFQRMDINKSLIDFLGFGNNIGQPLIAEIKENAEIFTYVQANVGFNFKKFRLHVKPAVFIPVLTINNSGGSVVFTNEADGTMKIHSDLNMAVYTTLDLTMKDGKIAVNTAALENTLYAGYGFDLAGSLSFPFTETFCIGADARVPIIPGRLNKKYLITSSFAFESTILEIGNKEFQFADPKVDRGIEEEVWINRPIKFFAYVDTKLFGKLIELNAGAGFGIRKPFTEASLFYMEYQLGATLNLFSILKVGLFTQYMDQVFAHGLGMTVNVRFVQLDVGATVQSASFKKSFVGAGAGAYAYVTVGF